MTDRPFRSAARTAALLGVLLLTGCPPRLMPAVVVPRPAVMPSYRDVVARYNANAGQIHRLWCHAVADITWTEDGKTHRQQGDGVLMAVLPDRISFSLGKLGNTLLWAAANEHFYWLFDLRDGATLFVGRRGPHGVREGHVLPVPIYPPDMIKVLGMGAIDAGPAAPSPRVEWDNGLVIEPPGGAMRLVIDPATYLPLEIDLLDAQGRPRLVARLSRPQPVALTGHPPGELPLMATILRLSIPNTANRMTLYLTDLSDGQGRIHDKVFDLNYLIKTVRPRVIKDLDTGAVGGTDARDDASGGSPR